MLDEVTLAGERVVLEPLRDAHAVELWPAADDPDVWRFMTMRVESVDDVHAWVRARRAQADAGTALAFLQRDAATGAAFGTTSLFDVDLAHKRGEVGYTWMARTHRGTGVNFEAKLLLLSHAFDALGLNRVQLKTDGRNLRSQRAIGKIGGVREGTLRQHMVMPDGFVRDTVVFSILRDEWPRVRERLRAALARA